MVCPITYGDHKQDILIYRYAYGNFPHTVYAPLYYAKFGAFFCATIVRLCINQGTVWDPIEAVQKRAIRIIHIPTHGMPYLSMLFYANLSSLTSRKEDLSCRFFFRWHDGSCLLSSQSSPPPRPSAVTSRFRSSQIFPKVHTGTKRYCSFIQYMYGLNYYHHKIKLEMWANAQRDGRPAEHRWRRLFNTAKFGWRLLIECRAVTLPRRETRWNL